jgi:hypothetical protein
MAVIRPFSPPVVNTTPKPVQTPTQQRGAAEARAAQRAFFQQALGDATPVRAAPVATAASHALATPATQDIRRPIPAEPPARIMRPGSFVDVKV